MKIDFAKKAIVITKKEAKAASKYDTPEYNEIMELQEKHPNFVVIVRETKSSPNRKSANKGFTYDKMEAYVNRHGSELQKQQFAEMREAAKELAGGSCVAYRFVKDWFDTNFPEASDFAVAVARITAAA